MNTYSIKEKDEKKLDELFQKYHDLLVYIRTRPDDPKSRLDFCKEVEKKYPDETSQIKEEGYLSNYGHGFTAGMVASIRLIRDLFAMKMEGLGDDNSKERKSWEISMRNMAFQRFPMLDT